MGRVQTAILGKLAKDPVQVLDIVDVPQGLDTVMDLVPFQHFHDLMVFIVQHAAYFGEGQSTVDPKVLKGPRGNPQQFSDLIGFEPFFVRLLVLVFQ